jgi:hypothetical protein
MLANYIKNNVNVKVNETKRGRKRKEISEQRKIE